MAAMEGAAPAGTGGLGAAGGGSGGAGGGTRPLDAGATGTAGAPGAAGPSDGRPSVTGDAAPPATSTGAAVMLNGQAVPREKAVVFLHIGHSNMAGRAPLQADLQAFNFTPDPLLWSHHSMNMVTGMGPFTWRPAKEPLSPDSMTGGKAGPGMALLRAGLAIAQPGTYLISIGHGHSGMQGGNCMGYRRAGLLYKIAMEPARALKGKVTFGAIFAMLGITERHLDPTVQSQFPDCVKGIADEMRADLGEPELPFILGDYGMGSKGELAPTGPIGTKLIPPIRMVPQKVTRSALVPTEGIEMLDDHHFTMRGHKEWGERAVRVLQEKGWAPWAK
jgi:hypothetical protein